MNEEIIHEKTLMEGFLDSIGGFESLVYSFAISLVLLIIISALKNWILNESKKKELMFMLLELPIDVCVILITIIVTGFIRGGGESIDGAKVSNGLILVFVSLLISIGCCFLRRLSMSLSYSEKMCRYILSGVCAVLNFIVAGTWIYITLEYICKHG